MDVPGSEPGGDEELAARAAAGDGPAFEALVIRYQARVYRLAVRMTQSDADARDVVQDAFWQAYRGLPSFRGAAKFSTWLYRIATNAALMQRRSRARRPVASLEEYLPRFDSDGLHCASPAEIQLATHADELIDRKRLAESARVALERLPDTYREAFVLRDLEDMPTAEVAQVLGLQPATVRQRVHRARLMLRGYLNHLVTEQA
jgi:RNA polymerase sigma-70 factor, ECF subfamily